MTRIIGNSKAEGPAAPLVKDWRHTAGRVDGGVGGRSQAATILMNARAQARAIVAEAQAQAAKETEVLRQDAWNAGYADGLAQGQHDVSAVMQRLAVLVGNAAESFEASVQNLDATVLDLVMAIARSVVRQELHTSPEAVLAIGRAALDEMALHTSVRLRVHPRDEPLLAEHADRLGLPPSVAVTVVADATVSAGGCIIESGAGRVDATIESQLARVDALLKDMLHAA